MDAYNAWSLVFSGLSAVGTLVAAGGAIFAIAQIRKHWRDDDTRAVIIPERKRNCTTSKGKSQAILSVRIVNVGKIDFTPYKFSFCYDWVKDFFDISSTLTGKYLLCQGAHCEATIYVTAKENGISLPELFAIKLVSAELNDLCQIVIKPVDSRAAVQDDAVRL